jgi:hypothetical protein
MNSTLSVGKQNGVALSGIGPANRGTVLRLANGLTVSMQAANVVRLLRIIGVSGVWLCCARMSCVVS